MTEGRSRYVPQGAIRRPMAVRCRQAAVLVAVPMLLAACGGAAAPRAAGGPAGTRAPRQAPAAASSTRSRPAPLTFSFDFVPNGDQSPFYAAQARGFYRAQGLKVKLVKGINASDSTQWVANGKADITYDSAGAAAQAITKGAQLKVLAVTFQENPFGLIYLAGHPLRGASDVYGKTVGVPPGTDAQISWRAFSATQRLDAARVHVVSVSPTTEAGLLGRRRVAAFSGAAYIFIPMATKLGMKTGFLSYAKYGVGGMAECIVTSDRYMKAHPRRVRAFLRATAEGFAFATAHPHRAATEMVHAVPQLNAVVTAAQFERSLAYLHSPHTRGKPWGWQAAADWRSELAFLERFEGLKHPLPVGSYYTDAYLPAAAGSAPSGA